MTVQFSVAVRNARLDAFETTAGANAKLRLYTGAMPANCAAAATGTNLLDLGLGADWMANAAAGVKGIASTWSGAAVGAGIAGYYRIYDSAGTTCHSQGTCATSGGDMNFDNTNIAVGQTVQVTAYSLTDGNP